MNNKISIIIPAYNVEKYISKCIESIINQTHKNLEIIIINDGSKDGTLEIIKEYASNDSRVVVIDKPNEGVSKARNDGLEKATGEYVLFVDADDWIELNTCEVALKNIFETSSDIVMFSYIREYENNSIKKSPIENNEVFEGRDLIERIHRRLVGPYTKEELSHPEKLSSYSPIWGKLYKSELVKKHKFKDIKDIGSSGEDTYFNIEIMPNVKKLSFINEFLYHYRKDNLNSITKAVDIDIHDKGLLHYNKLKELIKSQNVEASFFEALDNFFAINIISECLTIVSRKGKSKEKEEAIRKILNDERYIKCIKRLKTNSMKIHWRVFFLCVKQKNIFMVYTLANMMKKLSSKV